MEPSTIEGLFVLSMVAQRTRNIFEKAKIMHDNILSLNIVPNRKFNAKTPPEKNEFQCQKKVHRSEIMQEIDPSCSFNPIPNQRQTRNNSEMRWYSTNGISVRIPADRVNQTFLVELFTYLPFHS